MSDVQLQRAAALIRQKRYKQARALLLTVNRAQAAEWISQIDALEADTRKRRRRTAVLVALAVVAFLISSLVAVHLMLQDRFGPPTVQARAHQAQYEEVIRLIQAGQIAPRLASGGRAMLPDAYRHLSAAEDGEILIFGEGDDIEVLFYPRGVWVYAYSSQDMLIDTSGECNSPERERPNWFWFSCPWRIP